MTREEIMRQLNEVFCVVFDDEDIKITEATTADDIEDWDSLMHMSLVNAVERTFGVRFEMEDILKWENVGEMVDVIEREL